MILGICYVNEFLTPFLLCNVCSQGYSVMFISRALIPNKPRGPLNTFLKPHQSAETPNHKNLIQDPNPKTPTPTPP